MVWVAQVSCLNVPICCPFDVVQGIPLEKTFPVCCSLSLSRAWGSQLWLVCHAWGIYIVRFHSKESVCSCSPCARGIYALLWWLPIAMWACRITNSPGGDTACMKANMHTSLRGSAPVAKLGLHSDPWEKLCVTLHSFYLRAILRWCNSILGGYCGWVNYQCNCSLVFVLRSSLVWLWFSVPAWK